MTARVSVAHQTCFNAPLLCRFLWSIGYYCLYNSNNNTATSLPLHRRIMVCFSCVYLISCEWRPIHRKLFCDISFSTCYISYISNSIRGIYIAIKFMNTLCTSCQYPKDSLCWPLFVHTRTSSLVLYYMAL